MKNKKCNHIRNYRKFFNIGEQDVIVCEYCRCNKAVDIHHIDYRSQGGGDEISNLIALCRDCHSFAHNNFRTITKRQLLNKIKYRKCLKNKSNNY